MPTDLVALLARKRYPRMLAWDNAKLILVWFGISLLIIKALFAFQGFEEVVIAMDGYWFGALKTPRTVAGRTVILELKGCFDAELQ